ncbi:hypothetical protein [Chitinolyticbacter albus]|uniref:hypothetical protein n=1 Tax=Chitinolyticbacter albus TaxID=2961951 RepID=UPI00210DB990|nr:hypothetical protein [Chitinolyticbacter albus]
MTRKQTTTWALLAGLGIAALYCARNRRDACRRRDDAEAPHEPYHRWEGEGGNARPGSGPGQPG